MEAQSLINKSRFTYPIREASKSVPFSSAFRKVSDRNTLHAYPYLLERKSRLHGEADEEYPSFLSHFSAFLTLLHCFIEKKLKRGTCNRILK